MKSVAQTRTTTTRQGIYEQLGCFSRKYFLVVLYLVFCDDVRVRARLVLLLMIHLIPQRCTRYAEAVGPKRHHHHFCRNWIANQSASVSISIFREISWILSRRRRRRRQNIHAFSQPTRLSLARSARREEKKESEKKLVVQTSRTFSFFVLS